MTMYEIILVISYAAVGLAIACCGIDFTSKHTKAEEDFRKTILDFYFWVNLNDKKEIDRVINKASRKYNDYVKNYGELDDLKQMYYRALKCYNKVPDYKIR